MKTNTSIIGKNSFWYGIDVGSSFLFGIVSSVLIARVLGPVKLSHFLFISWMANTTASVGCMGLPVTTRKFMAQYLAGGEPGKARAVFRFSLYRQLAISIVVTCVAFLAVALLETPENRLMTSLIMCCFVPTMVKYIPSQANNAAENMMANVFSSIAAGLVYFTGVLLSLYLHWGLVGLAATTLLMQVTEMVLRLVPVLRWMRTLPLEPPDPALKKRLTSFSGKNLVLMALNLVVWDRSEFFFLQRLPDVSQLTYFSVAFNLTEKLLLLPKVFGFAAGSTIMAQFGRDRSKVGPTVSAMTRYLAIWCFAAHFGLAALAAPVMMIYGKNYLPAVMPLVIASTLGAWKSFLIPVQDALQGAEETGWLVKWGIATAVITLLLDWLLIGRYGAVGAAWANGLGQAFGTFLLFAIASRILAFRPPTAFVFRMLAIAAAMGVSVYLIFRTVHGAAGLTLGVISGGLIYMLLLKWTGGLSSEDVERFGRMGDRLPQPGRRGFAWLLSAMTPRPAPENPV